MFASEDRFGSEERSVFEAVSMAFLTDLDTDDKNAMKGKISKSFK